MWVTLMREEYDEEEFIENRNTLFSCTLTIFNLSCSKNVFRFPIYLVTCVAFSFVLEAEAG